MCLNLRLVRGKKSPKEAARELARPCYGGCFNTHRAEKLLAKMTGINNKRR